MDAVGVVDEGSGFEELPHELFDLEGVEAILVLFELVEDRVPHELEDEPYFAIGVMEEREEAHDVGVGEAAEDGYLAQGCFHDLRVSRRAYLLIGVGFLELFERDYGARGLVPGAVDDAVGAG